MDCIDKYLIHQHGQIQSQRAIKQIPHMQWELHSHLAKEMDIGKGGVGLGLLRQSTCYILTLTQWLEQNSLLYIFSLP